MPDHIKTPRLRGGHAAPEEAGEESASSRCQARACRGGPRTGRRDRAGTDRRHAAACVSAFDRARIHCTCPPAGRRKFPRGQRDRAGLDRLLPPACRGLRQCLRSIHRACPPPTGTAKQSRPRPPAYPLPRRCDAHAKRWPHSHACHSYFGSRGMSSLRRLFRAELVAGAG